MAESLALQQSKALDSQETAENEIIDVTAPTSDKPVQNEEIIKNMSPGAQKLRSWLNESLRIEMSDGRVLTGEFLCTDRDRNVILGSCCEYLPPTPDNDGKMQESTDDRRVLGLVMVPGKHIVTIHLDKNNPNNPTVDNKECS